MNKTIYLKKNISYSKLLLKGTVMATLTFSLVGIQSASALITSQLDLGDRGSEVTELQTYLSTDAQLYPSGLVTGYFGQLTKAGVERFQSAQGIVSSGTSATTGYGRVGPRTQVALNARLSGGGSFGGDVYAPVLRALSVVADTNGASVSWTASESSMGKVYYSTSPIIIGNTFDASGVFSGEPIVSGTLAQYDGVARTSHTVNINNLARNTTYYYLVVVFDASKNSSFTLPASFNTK
ncbi:MAG: hypothetical protein COV91_06280 [Candidatus Taylorbacteria bacterium CG11_big_fil_rev_8_21_14_0_20_46_11]|uniref:Peptidoglycan binding-like domain-containing protein n=1 Tax=Candidatus Taylorbacteria bacterium CG11_big_fil_rev_8_21_14_0_20_46_11 TaxID=1975025 RepID=A0A2H0K9V0_9BACT|nr:MAG: hypothetical protein COV91_06280 [Candidatus Taylorbacteria bacterium CG11_big_fil_rev_8_21_14_0_20_46_11]